MDGLEIVSFIQSHQEYHSEHTAMKTVNQNPTKSPCGINAPFKSDEFLVTFGALALLPMTSLESQSTFDIIVWING